MFCCIYLEIVLIIAVYIYTGIEVIWLGKCFIASIKADNDHRT